MTKYPSIQAMRAFIQPWEDPIQEVASLMKEGDLFSVGTQEERDRALDEFYSYAIQTPALLAAIAALEKLELETHQLKEKLK